ncbi:MAG: general secretion pathway protein C [Rhodoferax sp.]|uniref:general secretion pathway protein C n=1 Tax=Rhodoferax sp. TaxID=50421 RepID=UPI001B6DCE30|nr:general secretion pathway protein C [Rhodoferax sp.]MBP8285350.1 general secretion pathway protein C [Rhodoferax sp.]MBP9147822.1 general secretion pathway protein C [Rhodoferax sp.]MBP9737900.1 general secretion pathway protein C [Rhodoferax sp.]
MIIATMLRNPDSTPANLWLIRLLTLLLAAMAAASVTYWALKWQRGNTSPPPLPLVSEAPPIDSLAIARLLGAHSGAGLPEANTAMPQKNLKLMGVITQGGAGTRGSALISIEGAMAKPYRVGQPILDDLVLHSVKARTAYLAPDLQSKATITLELPPLTTLR